MKCLSLAKTPFMKFFILSFGLFITTLTLGQNGAAADQFVDRVVKQLKDIDTSDFEDFKEMLIDIDDISKLIDATNISDTQKKDALERVADGDLMEKMQPRFEQLKAFTREHDIQWSNIEFVDFVYQTRLSKGIKELKGDIYFTEDSGYYEVRVFAGGLDGEFELLELKNFEVSMTLRRHLMSPEEFEKEQEEMVKSLERMVEELEISMDPEITEKVMEEEPIVEDVPAPPAPPIEIRETEVVMSEIHEFPDVEAHFPGGQEALSNYIAKELVYPELSIEMKEEGRVYVRFIVEKDGSITNVQVMRGASPSLDREAKRLVRNMPNWIPGEQGGMKVRSSQNLPIEFRLD